MTDDRQERIRERAYALWEQEGRPEGDDLRHWVAALEEFGSEARASDIVAENTSVLGEPEPEDASSSNDRSTEVTPSTATSKQSGISGSMDNSSKTSSSQITTGEEGANLSVKHAEGP